MSLPPSTPFAAWPSGETGSSDPDASGAGQATDCEGAPPLSVAFSLASVLGAPGSVEVALSRYPGPRAELGFARARLRDAVGAGDLAEEARATADLARLLVGQGTELGQATTLAERSLAIREEPRLREELASWYRGLGDWALAAATLRPLLAHGSGERRARLLVRIAALLGRAADAAGAVSALLVAQGEDPQDPLAPELIGCVGGWAPEAVESARAAQAFLVAARRHAARGARAAAFEDLLRAFESAPDDGPACEELVAALEGRARHVAADEVRREHVRALGAAGQVIHARTVDEAARAGDWARALGAALDADWDAQPDLDAALRAVGLAEQAAESPGFDELAERVGLYQLIAARLELLADTTEGPERSLAHLALGRLWAGPLGDLDRAVDAWLGALASVPEPGEALAELGGAGSTVCDQAPVVEALVCVGADLDRAATADGIACVRELCRMVAEGPGDPAPIVWVSRRFRERGEQDAELAELEARFAPLLELEQASLERIRERLQAALGPERVAALRQLATLLRGRPEEFSEYLAVLEELSRLLPEESEWQHSLWRALRRSGHHEARQAELDRAAESAFSHADRVRARLELARLRYGLGDTPGAVEILRPLLGDPAAQAASWSRALCYAACTGDRRWRANALLALSLPLAPSVRAELACVAADDLLGVEEFAAARAAAEQALGADPSAGRAAATLGRVAARMGAPDAASLVERALGVVAPRAWLCRALGDTYAAQGEPVLALTWTQRWLSLGPGCLDAVRASLGRVAAAGDAERIENVIAWVISQPLPTAEYADGVAAALGRLGELDAERARAVARRVLDAVGPKHGAVRDAVVSVAELTRDAALLGVTLERSLEQETAPSLLEHARRLGGMGDVARAQRALCRAVALGADPAAVLAWQQAIPPTDSREAVLDGLAARTGALRALGATPVADLVRAWREYGAALWDLADDQAGASAAWREAAALDPEHGVERLLLDLETFGGPAAALAEIEHVARSGEHAAELPRLLSCGAYLAARAGHASQALELAERALDLDPSQADALGVAEQVAGPGETEALARIYQRLADAALGSFGERAVHYRGARQLERRRSSALAFDHAMGAFEAVPSAGITFRLLARLARATGRIGELVQAVERVAEKASDPATRAAWLELVARHTGGSEEGMRQRCRALFAALSAQPSSVTVAALGEAIRALVATCPEEREVLGLRVQRAVAVLLPRLAGPEGARTAIAAALLALDAAGAAEVAAAALERGARSDPSVEQYASLASRTAELGHVPALARRLVDVILELGRDRYGNAGRALCELGCALAEVLGDRRASAELGLRALERDPDDLALVRRVEQAVLGVDDPEFRALWFETVPPARRAEALFDLGVRRKEQGDNAGSVEAFRRALATPGLDDGERRVGLERLEGLFSLHGRAEALERLLEFAVDPRERIPWLRELGRLLGETDAPAAVRRYAELLDLEPDDPEALVALERDAERRGDYPALAELLRRQAALTSEAEQRRRLGLRRAVVLDQRLGRPDQARQELEGLLAETGDHPPVLRALAELSERVGDPACAAELWLRACRSIPDGQEVELLGRRACDAWLAAGDKERARLVTRTLGSRMDSHAALKLRVEVERKIGKSSELGQALEDYARALPENDDQRTALLVEAARVAEAAGDSTKALARAREAAALDPKAPGPGLIAELLAYRQRGAGDPAEAAATVRALEGMQGNLSPAQVELRSFLLAEALAAADESDRVRGELERALLQCGPRPLLAARLAEELSQDEDFSAALVLFDAALTGDLRGLRSRGKLAILGALAAERAGEPQRGIGWLGIALEDPETREQARAVERQIRAAPEGRSRSVESPPPSSSPLGVMRRPTPRVVEVPSGPPRRPTLPAFPATDEEEARLVGALANGSVEAGLALVARLEHRPSRAHDLLSACRQLSSLVPGDLEVLGCLAAAATADHNPIYARAVEHVRRAFAAGEPSVPPPPLGEQREQPERVKNLLARDADAAGEALGLVWEHAPQVFRRDPMAYGVTGLERIQIGAPTPLARLYAAAARLLGMSRTPLFQRRDSTDVTVSVALLSPPAVLLAGDVRRESSELAYHLGAMLAASAPERVLLFGSSEQQARDILGALLVGFGPPSAQHRGHTASTHLAEVLWQSIPARAQRRLRELGDDPAAFQYEPAMQTARRAVRRAGLLICGDLGVAVRETLADLSVELASEPHALASLAERFPDVADLVRLATSPEYAEARWQPGRSRAP